MNRWFESAKFIGENPELQNTHKYYEMSTEEKFYESMRKTNVAYKLDKEKWFTNHHPNTVPWGYACLGQNPTVLHQNMFTLTL